MSRVHNNLKHSLIFAFTLFGRGSFRIVSMATSMTCQETALNPLLTSWDAQPFSLPPFSQIQVKHYKPALEYAMSEHLNDLKAIVENPVAPTFQNVITEYDRSGVTLRNVQAVFGNMCSSLNTEELQPIQKEMSPILSRHRSTTYTLPGLFDKIQAVYETRHDDKNSNLSHQDIRLIERIYLDFIRAGSHFDEAMQQENADIQAKLASLTTEFMQNVQKDEEAYELVLHINDLSGCPESLIEAAQMAAVERHKADDEYVITLSRSLVVPFLTFSDRRDLRKLAFDAWTSRGEMHPDRDNLTIAKNMLQLRQRLARLHGFQNFAQYQCVDRMAKTPEAVIDLLENVWNKAKISANREREAMEEYLSGTGEILEGGIQAWDWRYYAEKVRQAKYDFDESLLKPYLSLESVTNAVFEVSNKLFGLKYNLRSDIQSYHPDVKTYEVRDSNDQLIAIFLHDNYARPFKNGGAWMSEYRSQTKNLKEGCNEYQGIPIVSNNNNFAKGSNTLLSFDDAITLFHEMVSIGWYLDLPMTFNFFDIFLYPRVMDIMGCYPIALILACPRRMF
jgi:peptidyl-dipeptidase Dcp